MYSYILALWWILNIFPFVNLRCILLPNDANKPKQGGKEILTIAISPLFIRKMPVGQETVLRNLKILRHLLAYYPLRSMLVRTISTIICADIAFQLHRHKAKDASFEPIITYALTGAVCLLQFVHPIPCFEAVQNWWPKFDKFLVNTVIARQNYATYMICKR